MGLRGTIESLLYSSAAITSAKETLNVTQLTPKLETFVVASEVKFVSLKQEHDETSCFESLEDVELEVLIDHFHYLKLEFMQLWDRLHDCYAILEDNVCASENVEVLITWAKSVFEVRRSNGNGNTL